MTTNNIHKVGVLGAGQMGRGIAQVAAAAGLDVILCDTTQEIAQNGKNNIAALLAKRVDAGKLAPEESAALLGRITPTADIGAFSGVDLAIEAVTENKEVKIGLFQKLDRALRAGALLASNTSSISITQLAASTSRPSSVIGMHFMNPVPLMALVEIVRGVQTSEETYLVIKALASRMGKTVVTSLDHPGFIVNRMLIPFLNEACFALQEHLGTPEDIDTGAKLGLNHPMGPLELADLIGLDTVLFIAEVLLREFADDKYRPATILRNLVAAGFLGKKSRRGFYLYNEKGQKVGSAL